MPPTTLLPAAVSHRCVATILIISLLAIVGSPHASAAETTDYQPPAGSPYVVQQHYIWCGEAKNPKERLKRFEKFWAKHRPAEADGYDDSAHIRIVRRCAYRLANLYLEAGRKQDCLKMLKWLENEDDTLDIAQD